MAEHLERLDGVAGSVSNRNLAILADDLTTSTSLSETLALSARAAEFVCVQLCEARLGGRWGVAGPSALQVFDGREGYTVGVRLVDVDPVPEFR
eukprot:4135667-Amphidinium_carterae.1